MFRRWKSVIPVKDGKADGKAKVFLTIENNLGDMVTTNEKIKFKNSKREGLCKT